MKKTYILPALLLTFAACTKHADDVEETPEEQIPQATLTISQPTAGGIYHNGDTVRFVAQAVSTENIHGYDLFVRKVNDTTNLHYVHIHDHNDTLNINTYWVNDRTSTQDLEGSIILYLDHDGHTLKKTVAFKAQ